MKTHGQIPDVLIANEDTLYLFYPLTVAAEEGMDEHVQADAQWFGSSLIVGMEDRPLRKIVAPPREQHSGTGEPRRVLRQLTGLD